MRNICAVFALVAAIGAHGDAVDAEVMHNVELASRVRDSSEYRRMILEASERMCQYDTNRYAQILVNMAQTNDARVANVAIARLGAVRCTAELPFLYSCVTNAAYAENAAYAILNTEGCTTSSTDLFRAFLADTNYTQRVRSEFAREIFRAACKEGTSETNRVLGARCVLDYAATANEHFTLLDGTMRWCDSGYRFSKRRLSVLRAVRDLGMHPYQLQYVTNAINELVAYPEANLPD